MKSKLISTVVIAASALSMAVSPIAIQAAVAQDQGYGAPPPPDQPPPNQGYNQGYNQGDQGGPPPDDNGGPPPDGQPVRYLFLTTKFEGGWMVLSESDSYRYYRALF